MYKRGILTIALLLISTPLLLGQTWSAPKRLTWNSGSSDYPEIVIDSNNHLHVIWTDDTSGNDELQYKKSTNGGSTWFGLKRLTWTSSESRFPSAVVDIADNIHVVWVEKAGETDPAEVYYKNSMDAGSSWSAPKRLTWTTGDTFQPCIRADSNNRLYVVFHDYTSGNAEVYFKKSTDGGSTWMAMKRLTWNSGASVFPTMAVDSNDNIRLTWIDTTSGNSEIYYRHSLDKGSTWSAVKRLTWNSGISTRPFVITDPSNAIHIFWDDDTPGRREIYYKKSSDGGLNWSGLKRLTWTTGHSQEANAAIGPGTNHLYLVWHDFTNNSEIYFKESTNGGSTWLPLKRITWNAGLTFHPNVAVDSNQYVHLVYDDRGPGNYEIFYRNRK